MKIVLAILFEKVSEFGRSILDDMKQGSTFIEILCHMMTNFGSYHHFFAFKILNFSSLQLDSKERLMEELHYHSIYSLPLSKKKEENNIILRIAMSYIDSAQLISGR